MHLKKCVPSLTKTRYLSFFWPSRVAASECAPPAATWSTTSFVRLSTAVGAVLNRFGLGEPPLQTELTTSLTPFVELRKKRDKLYGEPWPDPREFEATIAEVERSVAG